MALEEVAKQIFWVHWSSNENGLIFENLKTFAYTQISFLIKITPSLGYKKVKGVTDYPFSSSEAAIDHVDACHCIVFICVVECDREIYKISNILYISINQNCPHPSVTIKHIVRSFNECVRFR